MNAFINFLGEGGGVVGAHYRIDGVRRRSVRGCDAQGTVLGRRARGMPLALGRRGGATRSSAQSRRPGVHRHRARSVHTPRAFPKIKVMQKCFSQCTDALQCPLSVRRAFKKRMMLTAALANAHELARSARERGACPRKAQDERDDAARRLERAALH